jgi:hypothetical protein
LGHLFFFSLLGWGLGGSACDAVAAGCVDLTDRVSSSQINVRVVNQEGMEVFFKIKRSTPFK